MSAGTSPSSAAAVARVIGPDQERLPHVRDIEQAGLGARVQVLLEDAERDTARASRSPRTAPSWRRAPRAARRAGCVAEAGRKPGVALIYPTFHEACLPRREARVQAPSVAGPERFRRTRPPYPFGEPALEPAAFQSAINLRSVCLRGSGAVAPSAPAKSVRIGPVSSADLVWTARMIRACPVGRNKAIAALRRLAGWMDRRNTADAYCALRLADHRAAASTCQPAPGAARSKPTNTSNSAGREPSGIGNVTVRTIEK